MSALLASSGELRNHPGFENKSPRLPCGKLVASGKNVQSSGEILTPLRAET